MVFIMGLRPARTVRDMKGQAYTRKSKVQRKNYIKSVPHAHLNVYRMGTRKKDFNMVVNLIADEDVILRDNALESARQSANKHLEKKMPGEYYFVVRTYPHHVIRENRMISGAGADRLQKGMRKAYGKPTSRSARISKGTRVFTIYSYKTNANIKHIKEALKKAYLKMSKNYSITFEYLESPSAPSI